MLEILNSYDEKIVLLVIIPIVCILNFIYPNFGFWFVFIWSGVNLAYLKNEK